MRRMQAGDSCAGGGMPRSDGPVGRCPPEPAARRACAGGGRDRRPLTAHVLGRVVIGAPAEAPVRPLHDREPGRLLGRFGCKKVDRGPVTGAGVDSSSCSGSSAVNPSRSTWRVDGSGGRRKSAAVSSNAWRFPSAAARETSPGARAASPRGGCTRAPRGRGAARRRV